MAKKTHWDTEEYNFCPEDFDNGKHAKVDRSLHIKDAKLEDIPRLQKTLEELTANLEYIEINDCAFVVSRNSLRQKLSWELLLDIGGSRLMSKEEKQAYAKAMEEIDSRQEKNQEEADLKILKMIYKRNPHLLEKLK